MKPAFARLVIALCFTGLALTNCHKVPEPEPALSTCATLATVRDLTGLDGCGTVLVLGSGQRLQPTGTVWQSFRATDGQKVLMDYKDSPGTVSTCMVGKVVELTCIRELGTAPVVMPGGN